MNNQFELLLDKTTIYETLFFKILTKSTITDQDIKNQTKEYVDWYQFMRRKFRDTSEDDMINVMDINETKTRYFPEYAEITSIVFGVVKIENDETKIHIQHVNGETELEIVDRFFTIIEKFRAIKLDGYLCGHSIFKYDIPFLIKRGLKHNLKIPKSLKRTLVVKPWESNVIDVLELWKFTGTSYVDVFTIAKCLNIESNEVDFDKIADLPKKDLDELNKQTLLTIIKIYSKLREM